MKKDTRIVTAGRRKEWTGPTVSPPVHHASTILFDSVEDLKHATRNRDKGVMFYGRKGTPTQFSLAEAMCELEGAAGCALYPCGEAGVNAALLTFLSSGDHLLMVDTVYGPTRAICDTLLKRMNVSVTYYDPLIGGDIRGLIQDNTKVIFTESPGSVTMEIQDIPAIVEAAHEKDVIVMIDNTWSTPLHFRAHDHGVDVVIQSATKYLCGHSDALMGTVTATEKYWPMLRENSYLMGYYAAPDDVYLVLRGLRTLSVRLKQHEKNAMKVAQWLKERPEVDRVLHPAFEDCPGHDIWKRDFDGACGLFSVVFNKGNDGAVTALFDSLEHFKMGYSWGGFESLIMGFYDFKKERTACAWDATGPLVRLHVGLEDPDDLIEDLSQGLEKFNAVS